MSNYSVQNILREAAVAYESSSEFSMVEMARRGITKQSLSKLCEIASVSLREFSELLPVSLRTLQRYREEETLPPNVSEHILLIAEVLAKGLDIFDEKQQLRQWLQTSSIALGNQTPFSLLDTSFGIRMVTDELGRLEHGVFA